MHFNPGQPLSVRWLRGQARHAVSPLLVTCQTPRIGYVDLVVRSVLKKAGVVSGLFSFYRVPPSPDSVAILKPVPRGRGQ